MPQLRRTSWTLVATLFATMVFVAGPSMAFASHGGPSTDVDAVINPELVCSPTGMPTRWSDELHPPTTVRVLRSKGPNAGDVEVVNFWKYVGRVVRAEYSSGSSKPYPWMHIGAITVKQYAWYYAMNWRGSRVTTTDPVTGAITTNCYDVKDTTADQIYVDLKPDPLHPDPADPQHWKDANVPTTANLQAMRETWHMTIRKWQTDKNKSRIFLTGYRSGKQHPCGADSTGFKIYQKSLRDCGTKNLTLEETMREYFEPNMLVVDTRDRDMQNDSQWMGDLGVLVQSGQSANYQLFNGTATSFSAGATGQFANVGTVLGQGVGNVDQPGLDGAADAKMLADLVMLVNDNGRKLITARAKASGFDTPTTKALSGSPQLLLVADFDGDLFADAGLLSDAGSGNASLQVMRSLPDGTWGTAADWWTGPLDLDVDYVAAGDTNGDGKADLLMRSASTGTYSVAQSRASCSPVGAWGPCASGSVGAPGLSDATAWLTPTPAPTWDAANVMNTVGDYDRDGRDDVMAVVKNGTTFKVYGLRAKTDASGFADPLELYAGSMAFADVVPSALNVNSDGMSDLALMVRNGSSTNLVWLKANERTTAPASMTLMQPAFQTSLPWSPGNRLL